MLRNLLPRMVAAAAGPTLCLLPPPSCDEPREPREPLYYNFPLSEKFQMATEAPLWDSDWDGREKAYKALRGKVPGVTRHVILVRHGQYDETYKADEKRILTPLGREQAVQTGERLARMMSSDPASKSGSVTVKVTHVSDMARAKETADIIAATVKGLTNVELSRTPPNADLNEGRPCHIVPSGRAFSSESIRRDAPRIERAFRGYFYRHLPENWEGMLGEEERARKEEEGRRKEEEAARPDTKDHGSRLDSIERRLTGEPPPPPPPSAASELNDGWFSKLKKEKHDARKKEKEDNPAADATVVTSQTRHEYSVIVCHGNVIRYFFMRALQLPPEAWLRLCTFNCSLTYFTIRPSGNVSCRTLGDIGHLDMERTTFSGHHGFNW